jgi:ribosomal protein S18 acetylase RimI-like enzyme
LLLRRATSADAAEVAEIWSQGWAEGHLGNVPARLVAARTAQSFHDRAAERVADTTVAVVDGRVAGFIMVVADELEQMYVSSDHRGSGVAATLLAEAERLVRRQGFEQSWLAVVAGNSRARRFYERNGWTDEGLFEHLAPDGTDVIPVPAHKYVKRL